MTGDALGDDETRDGPHATPGDLDDESALRGLGAAVASMREAPPVSAAWRRALDRELRRAHPASRRRVTVSPMVAIAAGLACVSLGAAGAWMVEPAATDRAPMPTIAPTATATPAIYASDGSLAAAAGVSRVSVRFAIVARDAGRVSVVGDFNGWNPSATPMRLLQDRMTWATVAPLAPGRHAYAFLIDGELVADPAAPRAADDDFGVPNSLVLVSARP